MTAMLDAALEYQAMKLAVFPVKVDKTPLTPHGLKDATLLEITAREYWGMHPQAGIGVVTDGLIVLDFDKAHGGLESLDQMQARFGTFPRTRTHQTGGGGIHLLFQSPNHGDHRNAVNFAGYQGVDIRANGGYIVVPPSHHVSGDDYVVLDYSPIAECPAWLTDLLSKRGKPIYTDGGAQDVVIIEGHRNASLASLAGSMRRQGCSQAIIESTLLATNTSQCNPPLPEKDVLRIAKSIARYEPEPTTDILDDAYLDNVDADIIDKTDNADIIDSSDKLTNADITLTSHNPVLGTGINVPSITTPRAPAPRNTSTLEYAPSPRQTLESDGACLPDPTPETDADRHVDLKVWPKVDEWLIYHRGERFDLNLICQQLDAKNAITRHSVVKKLSHEVKKGKLEKTDRQYTMVNVAYTPIDWVSADPTKILDLRWPYGIQDGSRFGFDGHMIFRPGHVMVVAGVSNYGKTCFALNFLWANMNHFPCTLMGNEYTPETFKARVMKMDWEDPLYPSGNPKFELIERRERWKDIIRPDNLNIIDWINLGDCFYQIGSIIEGIQSKLKTGMALIVLQKDAGKSLGLGGGFSQHLASLYLTIDRGRLTCVKAKEWTKGYNPNGKTWAFQIEEGVRFHDLREVRICYKCGGTGQVPRTGDCQNCYGKGYLET